MWLTYGLALVQNHDDAEEELEAREDSQRPERTRLTMRDGSRLTVVRSQERQTSMYWRGTAGDATFDIGLSLLFPPRAAVQVLAEGASLPLRQP